MAKQKKHFTFHDILEKVSEAVRQHLSPGASKRKETEQEHNGWLLFGSKNTIQFMENTEVQSASQELVASLQMEPPALPVGFVEDVETLIRQNITLKKVEFQFLRNCLSKLLVAFLSVLSVLLLGPNSSSDLLRVVSTLNYLNGRLHDGNCFE